MNFKKAVLQILESASLEKAFDNPSILWLQGLNEKEFKKLKKILLSNFNNKTTKERTFKAFPSLTEELYKRFENLCKQIFFKKIDKKYIIKTKGNFCNLGFYIGYIDDPRETLIKELKKMR